MPNDPNIPTDDVIDLCACPIDWVGIDGFGDECPEALELLHYEWVRCVARVSVSSEELRLIEDVLFDSELYEPPSNDVLINLRSRRDEAVDLYLKELGRLGGIRFLCPSEHGKHYAVAGPRRTGQKISFFYTDLRSSTLANLFWSWFDDMMLVEETPPRTGPIDFLRNVGPLWERFRTDRTIRIAINVTAPLGEFNGTPLDHIAIDLDLLAKVAHAYPVSHAEAIAIMNPFEVRLIKSWEY